jgi:hypothetical protein
MKETKKLVKAFLIIALFFSLGLFMRVRAADPVSPDDIDLIRNVTKNATTAEFVNISGGRIAVLNVNATIQNPRWKAFVGNVTGKFTLDDPEGSTVFDWTISSITGRIYATSNYSALSWSTTNCSNITHLENENYRFNHTRADDNITKTFNATYNDTSGKTVSGGHQPFHVAGRYMPANTCPTLNTYESSNPQDTDFEEVALYDGNNMIYAVILEDDETGYNDNSYDFQMIVPESGLPAADIVTAYYIYVEIGT